MKILIVDDERDFLEQTEIFLGQLESDLEIDSVLSAEEALEELKKQDYDAIVSDYQMPGMDGLDLLKVLREERDIDIPFIIFTGKGREEVAMEALNLGADRYLRKGGESEVQYAVLADAIKQEVKHHKTKEHLDARKEQFEKAVQNAPYPAMLHTEDGEVVSINELWTEITGYEKEDIPTLDDWLEKAYGEKKDEVKIHLDSLYDIGGRVDEGVYTIKTKGGEEREWEFSSSPLGELPDGKSIVLSMANDITERRRMERALKESEEKYKNLFYETPLGTFYYNEEGIIKECNEKFVEIIGSSREALIGLDMLHDLEDEKMVQEVRMSLKEGEGCYEGDYTSVTGEKTTPVRVIFKGLKNDEKEISAGIGLVEDITPQKRAEEELKDAKEEWEEIFQAICHPTVILDSEQNILQANEAALDELDTSMEELRGQKCYEIFHDKDEPPENCPTRKLFESGKVEIEDMEIELLGGYYLVSVVPIYDEDGQLEKMIHIATDITERKEAKQRIEHLNYLLETIKEINQIIVQEDDLEKMMHQVCDSLVDEGPFVGSSIALLNEEEDEIEAVANSGEHVFTRDWSITPDGSGEAPRCIKEVMDSQQIKTVDREGCGDCSFEMSENCKRCIFVPMERGDRMIGFISLGSPERGTLSKEEKDLLKEVASDLAYAREKFQAERALRESEERYRRLFETAQDGMLILDGSSGKIIDANPYIKEILGYSKEELEGKHLWELGTFDDIVENRKKFEELKEEGYARYEDLPLETKEGERVPVEFVSNTYEAGNEEVIQCNIRDISERKEAESRYRSLFEEMNEGVALHEMIYDDSGEAIDYRIIAVNPSFEDILGLEKEDVLGKRATEVYEPEEAPYLDRYSEIAGEGKSMDFETFYEPIDKYFHISVFSPGEDRFATVFSDITEEREARKELEKKRRLLKKTEEVSKIGGWEYDVEKEEMYWTDNLYELHGFSRDEEDLIEKSLACYPPEARKEVKRTFERAVQEGEPYDIEVTFVNADGEDLWVRTVGEPVEEDGEVVKIVGNMMDITERKETEKELKEINRTLSTLMMNIPGMAYRCLNDKDWTMKFLSDACSDLTGYEPFELIENEKLSYNDVIHPDDREFVWEEVQKAVEKEEPFEIEYRIITSSGGVRWVWEQGRATEYRREEPEILEGIIMDITDRKEAEVALKRSEERFRNVFENSTVGMYRTTPDGQILMANPALVDMLGYSSFEELSERDLGEEGYEPKYPRSDFKRQIEEQGEVKGLESVWMTRDGEKIYVRESARAVEDEDGNIEYYEGTVEDITDKKDAEERQEFLHSVLRHDVKNKIQVAKGYLKLMQEEGERKDYPEKIEKSLRNAEEIIKKVRTMRKIGEGEKEEIGLSEVMDHVISEYRGQLNDEDIDIEIENVEGQVRAGPLLKTVFTNLIENAVRHSGCDEIHVRCESEGDEFIIRIEDDGKGIPEDKKERVLEKGYHKGEKAGSGLGLFLVKEIVEKYGGTLNVQDSEMGGARFNVHLRKVQRS